MTEPEHFKHVKAVDLEKIGMSGPAQRRLMQAVKKKRKFIKKVSFIYFL